jgi:NADPH:quinone reductase-like Zn-dependent oxidoreductase
LTLSTLSHNEAAAVPLAALTAWQALFDHGRLKKGERVLVHAGAGGVGSFAIQFAKWSGAHVIATASAANEKLVRDLGADEFVDYRSQRFEDVLAKVDVVLDSIGGDTQTRSVQLLNPGGRLFSLVAAPDEASLAAVGATGGWFMVQPSSTDLGRIGKLIDEGTVRVLIDSVFPLSGARAAHTKSETGRAQGKIVLEIVPA